MYVSDLEAERKGGRGIAFSRTKIFSLFQSSPPPSLLEETTLLSIHLTTISQTNSRRKFSMKRNQRTIYIVSQSFKIQKIPSNPCNNNLFPRRRGRRRRRKIRMQKQFAIVQCLENWKQRTGIFVPRRLSAMDGKREKADTCTSDKICRFSIRASITCTPNSGTCWWLRSRERGLDRV